MTEAEHGGPPARRFDDDEVAAILRRASMRDLAGGLPSPHDPTLGDLMAAAREVGLDADEVRRAAAVEVRRTRGVVDAVMGAPDRREVWARLEGARIPEDTRRVERWAEEAMGRRGTVVQGDPGRFVWLAHGAGSRNSVTLVEQDGAVELTVATERAGYYAGLLFMGLLAWAGLSMATPLGALPMLGKIVGLFVTPPLVVRPFWAASDRRIQEGLERLALRILRASDEAGPIAPTSGAIGTDA